MNEQNFMLEKLTLEEKIKFVSKLIIPSKLLCNYYERLIKIFYKKLFLYTLKELEIFVNRYLEKLLTC